jgi:hypothetical protein
MYMVLLRSATTVHVGTWSLLYENESDSAPALVHRCESICLTRCGYRPLLHPQTNQRSRYQNVWKHLIILPICVLHGLFRVMPFCSRAIQLSPIRGTWRRPTLVWVWTVLQIYIRIFMFGSCLFVLIGYQIHPLNAFSAPRSQSE